jgi:hypothetical protein
MSIYTIYPKDSTIAPYVSLQFLAFHEIIHFLTNGPAIPNQSRIEPSVDSQYKTRFEIDLN